MRIKRLGKFKKKRHLKFRNIIIITIILPFASIFIGYLITAFVILPSMTK